MLKKIYNKKNVIKKENYIYLLLLIFVFSGIFGFIYEEIFYRIDLGYFVKRGTTFGPWIPIYGFGALFVTVFCYKLKDRPLLVFFLVAVITGLLEFLTGYFCYHVLDTRLWDYNIEIWNYGNIGGYVCLRSVLFFSISSMLLLYILIPFFNYVINNSRVRNCSVFACCLFIFDIVVSLIV